VKDFSIPSLPGGDVFGGVSWRFEASGTVAERDLPSKFASIIEDDTVWTT